MHSFLVTGGCGFIGSHVAEELVRQGKKVTILDNLFTGKLSNIEKIKHRVEFIKGSIINQKLLEKAFKNVDYVLHQAALRSVPLSMKMPKKFVDVNIKGTLNVLEAARKQNIKRVVFASSSSIYGNTNKFPQKESFLPKPLSTYAMTKVAGEHLCKMYFQNHGLETVSLRYFNVFGPKQAFKSSYSTVIPLFIKAVLENRQPTIYGDGFQSRDFTFVSNVVDANIKAALKKRVAGKTFNIAEGKTINLLQLLKKINKILGKNVKPKFAESRIGDIRKTFADISEAKKHLGFKIIDSFDVGLKKTIEWIKIS